MINAFASTTRISGSAGGDTTPTPRQRAERAVTMAIDRARRERSLLALALVEVEDHAGLSKTFGRSAAEFLLDEITARLKRCAGPFSLVQYLGNDEFLLLRERAGTPIDAERIARHVQATLAEPFAWDLSRIDLSAGVGMVFLDCERDSATLLVDRADDALSIAMLDDTRRHVVPPLRRPVVMYREHFHVG